jgi:hypothetical protein
MVTGSLCSERSIPTIKGWGRGALAASLLSVAGTAGCFYHTVDDCEQVHTCPPNSTDSGTGGGTPAACVPSANDTPVDDTCGVFVSGSLGKDGGAGNKSAPVKTLQQAIDKAKGRPIYACAEALTGSVTLASGSAIYGGLDCTKGWAYVGATKKSALTGEADKPALTFAKEASGAEITDFTIQAANATATGGSSIAVIADQVMASLTRCDLVAGDGASGADGQGAASTSAQAGKDGTKGGDACSFGTVNGGAQVENTCGMEISVGGNGGNGTQTNGTAGSPGLPNNGGGQAGQGDDGSVGWSCAGNGGEGKTGLPGESGKEGAGAATTDLGALTATGFTPVAGGDGQPGKIGQGGGGGGGVKGGTVACGGKPPGGASGGSGGAGGCGGAGGKGGKGGGASLALVSLKASLTLTEVTLTTGKGGKGGAGGDLQKGGTSGLGGLGGSDGGTTLNAGCKGGDGGNGGNGGPGGGGRGGHAIGLVFSGMAPTMDVKQMTIGTAGPGGAGGNNNVKNNAGAAGVAAPVREFL